MARLSLRGIKKRFKAIEVLHGVDLDVNDRELIVFVGPSGCGKSTLLRLIAGLDPISDGEFLLNGQRMNELAPSRRGIAMVFQSYALYPHMNVYENMAFGARLMGLGKAEVEARIQEATHMLRLEALLERKPRELSGGQRQRVAIGRALVRKPQLLLLDEPLSNLDAALRSEVRLEIARLHREIGGTTIYVTHDQVEAMTLADRIVVMNGGRIEQFGSPRELYETPANTFVANFIGSPRMAMLSVEREGDRLVAPGVGEINLSRLPSARDRELLLGVRPDGMNISSDLHGDGFSAEVVYTEYLGDSAYVYVRMGDAAPVSIRCTPDTQFVSGTPVRVSVAPDRLHFFSRETSERLAV
ncbi:sn-glycerol-3-phosphate ABC transporter ATP-binding protein UgpC (plasmid) [Rhizobium oryzihabitans]|uniref:sn-glycerol-3-phosphate ABC transporter ATP-binding protein UgpC n=2 Tax=Rhizobium/Agrobacterium group TaxID=227290 RepID=A0A7L5BRE7_9HYPH|nr:MULTISPECIES: sn-glycerol-3-phosphate ABC transporter ATP-binding protein UgpC [Rhizobium/Agrobacterium group]QIB41460.1 sn-glycerol-3-phosphate ABC transporter ATP-binding protein UgpC [Rhizobium oryzihabitans]RSC24863.1 sn-glycerol-3-phosphate ABC transporter ATP-binding protein UgpC [Agrobacterium sp. FDAARGOS_525]